jgi:hypothetical protein
VIATKDELVAAFDEAGEFREASAARPNPSPAQHPPAICASGAAHDGDVGLGATALWATPGAGLRASAALPYRVGIEAGAGVQGPMVRREVFAGQSSLYRAEIVIFQATFGLSIGYLDRLGMART